MNANSTRMRYWLNGELSVDVDLKKGTYTLYDGDEAVHTNEFTPELYRTAREVVTKRAVFAAAVYLRDNLGRGWAVR